MQEVYSQATASSLVLLFCVNIHSSALGLSEQTAEGNRLWTRSTGPCRNSIFAQVWNEFQAPLGGGNDHLLFRNLILHLSYVKCHYGSHVTDHNLKQLHRLVAAPKLSINYFLFAHSPPCSFYIASRMWTTRLSVQLAIYVLNLHIPLYSFFCR